MGFVAFLIIGAGVYLIDAAIQNRKPLATLRDVIKNPAGVANTLAKTKGTGYATPVYDPAAYSPSPGASPPTGGGSATVNAAIAFARAQIGKPYRWGATGPDSFDCSGLVQAAFKSAGVKLPRTSYQMLTVGTKVSQNGLQPGDLVWPDLGHVAIYTGGGMMVEAPSPGSRVQEVKVYRFYTARRVTGGGTISV